MASYTIIEDGYITEPYKTNYNLQPLEGQNTIRNIDENKQGMIVTFHANGKSDVTQYTEIENIVIDEMGIIQYIDDAFPSAETRDYWLMQIATSYENS